MPPKRKSLVGSWCACEACGVLVSHKDSQLHQDLCPADESNYQQPFIKNAVLFSFIEKHSVNDFADKQYYGDSSFVFLSQSAMQLCCFEIGEPVILILNNDRAAIRTVWPTTERTLTSVILSPKDTAFNNNELENSTRIKVQKMKWKPVPASLVDLVSDEDVSENNVEHFLAVCKNLYFNKFLMIGSTLQIPFYGKTIILKVNKLLPVDRLSNSEDLLSEQLSALNIKNVLEKESYVIIETTKWVLSQNPSKKGQLTEPVKKSPKFVFGGYEEITKELSATMSLVLKRKGLTSNSSRSVGVLLYGPNGVGKTFISQSIANEMNVPVLQINSGEVFSKFYGETELRLRSVFEEARSKSPCIILLDNVDTLCPKKAASEQERRVVAYLLTLLDSIRHDHIVVLATTSQTNLIDSSLRRPGRLDYEIELPVPTVNDRFQILNVLLKTERVEESGVMNIAKAAHGFVAADLQCLVAKAKMQASSQDRDDIKAPDLVWALSQVKPSAMREVLIQVPNIKWTDIGGMETLKLKLQQTIEWPLLHPKSFSRLGISPPRGVLMYGPPGCSKTMIAKALASESNLNFLSIKGSELFSKWVGESEKAVQALFKKARAVAPSIVFLDELDAIGGERSGASEGSNVQERVLAQLLTEMDGVEPLGNVNIVAATNRPDRIDKALLRPGRLDRMVYVPLPDLSTRVSILRLQLNKMPAKNVDINDLATRTEGYSGAEVVAICHEAAINALQEDLNADEVLERHFHSALHMVQPRTPTSLLDLYNSYSQR